MKKKQEKPVLASAYAGVAFDELPGSWPLLFGPLYRRAHFSAVPGPAIDDLNNVLAAVKYLIDACPEDTLTQIAARRGGKVLDAPSGEHAIMAVLRSAALVEIIQEAQKQRQSISAYQRVLKQLRVLGISVEHSKRVLFALEYCDRTGEPYPWLAKKLAEKKGKKK